VEPLQSTALTTACLLANRLTNLLGKHARVNHAGLQRVYNETTRATWEEIYDFISIYYKYNAGTTEFWEDARSINPGTVPQYDSYQETGFGSWRDIFRLTRAGTDLNEPYVYCLVLAGLGAESEFYENLEFGVDREVARTVDEYTAGLSDRVDEFLTYEELLHTYHPGYD